MIKEMPQNHKYTKFYNKVILRILPKDLHSLMLAKFDLRKPLTTALINLK